MLIANPIYDTVFKYLFDDKEVARTLISAILDLSIEDLELQSKDIPLTFPKSLEHPDATINVMRLDFKAKIRLKNGEQVLVLIELQKAKVLSEIGRFRRYLGSQYIDKKNLIESDKKEVTGIPIISIYLLGYDLNNCKETPIINVKRSYIDNYTQNILLEKEAFIESLTHDSVVIQVPVLKRFRRNKLEKLLNIFSLATDVEQSFDSLDFPQEYNRILDRLSHAFMDEILLESAISEKEYLDEYMKKIATSEDEKQQAIEREKEAIKEKEIALKEKEEAILKQEEAQKREKEALLSLKKMIQKMHAKGFTIAEIAEDLDKSEEEICQLLA